MILRERDLFPPTLFKVIVSPKLLTMKKLLTQVVLGKKFVS
jgi:hypothetical protein